MASSPLIVDAQLSPNLVGPRFRQSPMTARAQQRGCLVVGVTEPTSRPGRQRSLRYTPKAGRKNSSGQVRNDGRAQVESHLGRNRLTLDAPYKATLILQAVSWYLRYPLSYRDIEELFLERGLAVDHSTLNGLDGVDAPDGISVPEWGC